MKLLLATSRIGVILLSCWLQAVAQVPDKQPVDYVDPLIGTANSTTEAAKRHSESASELKGQTFPAVGVPHGMTSWTPQTRASEQKCLSPYYHADPKIQGFRASHWMSGSCTQDYGSVTLMPVGKSLKTSAEARAVPYQHAQEQAHADYYRVQLAELGITAEMTGDSHSAIFRFTHAENGEYYVVVEPNSDEGLGYVRVDPEKREIVGYNPVHRIYQGWGKPAGFSGHFLIRFDRKAVEFGTWNGEEVAQGIAEATGNKSKVGAYYRVKIKKGGVLQAKVGMSFTSLEQARKNLDAEIPDWDFDVVRAKSREAWNEALGKLLAKGSDKDMVKFYTAFYHALLLPRVHSDVDGTYNGFGDDNALHKAEWFAYYEDFSMWDTYRAVHPLLTLTDPQKATDMANSLVKKAEQGGWMPIFPCWNHYTAAMIGDHVTAMIGDAFLKGIIGFDVATAYQFLRKNAFEPNPDLQRYRDGMGRRALESYLQYGYIPLEDSVPDAFHKREQVSRTLEYAYNDFVLGQMAKNLGHLADYEALRQRAKNWQNVFDTATGYVRGRYADGSWVEGFDPFAKRAPFITEGSPFQYTWYVPHDMHALMERMGGKEKAAQQLDLMFSDAGHYWHGNEPGHQIPYLYPFAGQPWKTQRVVRQLIRDEYDTGPGGLSGNEDAGQMSAWLVFSMLGFYPVAPGTPVYVLGSPAFEEIALRTQLGNYFRIRAENNSEANPYIQSATLNGEPMNRAYLFHGEIISGGELVLRMGPEPNKEWGKNLPPVID